MKVTFDLVGGKNAEIWVNQVLIAPQHFSRVFKLPGLALWGWLGLSVSIKRPGGFGHLVTAV